MPTRNKYLLLNYIFIGCLILLVLNDHYFKYEYASWLTGKLSDAAGIVILPLLLTYLFPTLNKWVIPISALLFTFWKSPFSQSAIDLYNQYSFIATSRIVDYTDVLVLLLLPLPWYIINNSMPWQRIVIRRVHPMIILLPTVAALMATSPPYSHHFTWTEGNLRCYKCHFTVDYSQEEIIAKLKEADIVFDSAWTYEERHNGYPWLKDGERINLFRIDTLVIDTDTLRNIDFTMRTLRNKKTKIYFNGLQTAADISKLKLELSVRRYYRRLLFNFMKPKLKK